ncbi:MAG: OB-fold nucleic acid binding domain-containing protein, partial [Nitrososphaeria archaeon]|nr:OB-fold nucleic acid binding domain-containing protein [Nitrososphaeria archaeon]
MEEEFEKLMARVLKAIPGISREEVEAMVDEKVKSNLYLNRVGALLLVAEELGIFDVREKVSEEILEEASYVNLGELVPGLNNVSVKGVIYAVIGPITSKNYRLLKLKVGDRTGRLEVYVWEDKIKEIENLSLRVGDHIAIINAHTKEKLETGEVEIHLKKTSIIKKLYRDPSLPDLSLIH